MREPDPITRCFKLPLGLTKDEWMLAFLPVYAIPGRFNYIRHIHPDMTQYIEALSGLLAIQCQQVVPSKKVPEPSNQPTRNHNRPDEVCTARETVDSYIVTYNRDYEGRDLADVYITAGLLAEVVGFSKETARRRLKYFEEQGVVKTVIEDSYRDYYELTDEFSALSDENIRSETEVADTAKKLLALAEEK